MAELHRSRPGTHEVRRIARGHIGKALELLTGKSFTDEDVHGARKELKKARASLRLLRDALGDSVYRRENAVLRDAARPLSEVRDGKVLLEALDKLVKRYGAPARELPLDRLRSALRRELAVRRREILRARGALKAQCEGLRGAHDRAARWRVGHQGWSVVGAGLKRGYAQGRRTFGVAQAERTPENLHEWRKQVKYLWHQLQILEPLWPGLIGELADQAHKLANYLGDDHDLAVLRGKVLEHSEALHDEAARSALLALIDRCRGDLEDKAFVLGRRLYEEKPKALATRFGQYWRDWQHESRSAA